VTDVTTPETTPPPMPAVRLVTAPATVPRVRAGMGDVSAPHVEIWTDEAERSAKGLFAVLGADGRIDRVALGAIEPHRLAALGRDALAAMLRLRAFDDATARTIAADVRAETYSSPRNLEAGLVGAIAALAPDDVVAPGARHVGAAVFRGLTLAALASELHGGRGIRGHGTRPAAIPRALGVLPPSTGNGRQIPIATGVAWAAKMQRKPTVVLAYLDATDTDAEDFHAGVNFAAVYRTPAIFVSVGARAPASAALGETVAIKALAYGIPGVRVDGQDVLAVFSAVRAAAERARRGDGPTLIEAAPGSEDPLDRLRRWLAAEDILPAAGESALRAQIDRDVKAAFGPEKV
jgi:pyruvate dehydrogenase E1 component subunit alpha